MADDFAGAKRRLTREHNERMNAAWVTARLAAYPPKKPRDFPKVEKLLIAEGGPKKVRRQTWREQLAITSGW